MTAGEDRFFLFRGAKMSSLFGTMSLSLRALFAQQAGLQTTSDNIANVNTPGYSRKRAVLVEDVAFVDSIGSTGTGVQVQDIESLRDRVLELRICEETQHEAALKSFLGAMKQVDAQFSDVENGIGSRVDKFFAAISALATDPSGAPQRQEILLSAKNLAGSFRTATKDLRALQLMLDSNLQENVDRINGLSARIAKLSSGISSPHSASDAGTLQDQRAELIRELAENVDIAVIQSDSGVTVTTKSGALLVGGGRSYELVTRPDSSGLSRIYSGEEDITTQIQSGAVGGLLRARDSSISDVLERLNELAGEIVTEVNAANAAGFDLQGVAGGNIFQSVATDAAANMDLAISDPNRICASSDASIGDNRNLEKFESVRNGLIVDGQTPIDYYASVVAFIGNETSDADADLGASEVVLRNLLDQRGAISGVSLDEEAANLVRYQRAYEASAKVISVVDDLLQTLLAMVQR